MRPQTGRPHHGFLALSHMRSLRRALQGVRPMEDSSAALETVRLPGEEVRRGLSLATVRLQGEEVRRGQPLETVRLPGEEVSRGLPLETVRQPGGEVMRELSMGCVRQPSGEVPWPQMSIRREEGSALRCSKSAGKTQGGRHDGGCLGLYGGQA